MKPPVAPVSADDDILEMTPDGEFDTSKTSTLPKAVESNAGEGEAAAEEEDNTPPPIGNGGSTDKSIEIIHDLLGKPKIKTIPKLTLLVKSHQIKHCHLSISDEKNIAVAFVILEQ